MPRRQSVPSYRLHKSSGQARVLIGGRHNYLGKYGSSKSREKYARLIAEHFGPAADLRKAESPSESERETKSEDDFPQISVDELLLAYLDFAAGYYVKNGRPTKELRSIKEAMGHLRALYASLPARQFKPRKLKAVRRYMIEVCDLSRGVINQRINRIRRIFRWGVAEELIPPAVYEALRAVPRLSYGRTEARETEPIKPVPDAFVDATLPYLSPQVAAMVDLQRITGMRPCEVVLMRPSDIDTSGEVWIYEPCEHKNQWRGHRRLVPLGPRAQQIVRPFLVRQTDAFLFSPRDAEEQRNAERRRNRKTPMTPSHRKRRPKRRPKRPKRERYDTDSYRRAIAYGICRANKDRAESEQIPKWCPLQLRHSYATQVRKRFGVEAAQVGLGHARTNVVEVYAEKNLGLAIEIAKNVG